MPNSNEYMREYMKNRRKTRRDKLIAMSGSKCAHCDETEGLEFNHLDRSTKLFILSGEYLDKAWEKLLEEWAKCELVCRLHHLQYTQMQWDTGQLVQTTKNFDPYLHGSPRTYHETKCRCDLCKEAKRLYRAGKIANRDVIPLGQPSACWA